MTSFPHWNDAPDRKKLLSTWRIVENLGHGHQAFLAEIQDVAPDLCSALQVVVLWLSPASYNIHVHPRKLWCSWLLYAGTILLLSNGHANIGSAKPILSALRMISNVSVIRFTLPISKQCMPPEAVAYEALICRTPGDRYPCALSKCQIS